jgi:hypothetical protein
MARKRKLTRTASGEHFAKLIRATMETPAWRALSPTAQALYPWLKLEWRGPEANNNGSIRLSVRDAARKLGVADQNTAARAFHDLQAKGFIVMTEHAVLGVEGRAKSPAYELTELALHCGERPEGRKLYRDWQPGADFPVHKARAHNPSGANGKSETRHENHDGAVVPFTTKARRPS